MKMKRFIQIFLGIFLIMFFSLEIVDSQHVMSTEKPFDIAVYNQSAFATNFETTKDWQLVLVNSEHILNREYPVTLGNVSEFSVDNRIVAELNAMLNDAKADGYPLKLYSTYRSFDGSQVAFNRKLRELQDTGMSYDQSFELTNKWIALPGESEHNTGLAIDVVSPNYFDTYKELHHVFEEFPEYGWLINHCADYGFILRYPKHKQDVTNITFEPWHFRYVGIDHAKYIMENNICLEEYLALFEREGE